MKFYDCATAPSTRRVRIFFAEKGISVPTVQVDFRNGEQFSPAFRVINPDCTVPVLELDNGTRIADIVAICRYFEELYPEPRLMGRTAEEKAVIEAWQRRIERDGFYAAMEVFRNSTPGLKGRALPGSEDYDQIPALAERGRARISISLPGLARASRRTNLSVARSCHCRFSVSRRIFAGKADMTRTWSLRPSDPELTSPGSATSYSRLRDLFRRQKLEKTSTLGRSERYSGRPMQCSQRSSGRLGPASLVSIAQCGVGVRALRSVVRCDIPSPAGEFGWPSPLRKCPFASTSHGPICLGRE